MTREPHKNESSYGIIINNIHNKTMKKKEKSIVSLSTLHYECTKNIRVESDSDYILCDILSTF